MTDHRHDSRKSRVLICNKSTPLAGEKVKCLKTILSLMRILSKNMKFFFEVLSALFEKGTTPTARITVLAFVQKSCVGVYG